MSHAQTLLFPVLDNSALGSFPLDFFLTLQVKRETPNNRCCSCSASLQIHDPGTSRVKQLGLLKAAVPELPPVWLWAALRAVSRAAMGHGQLPPACTTNAARRVLSLLAKCHSLQSIHQEKGSIRSTKVFDINRTKETWRGFSAITSGQFTSAVPASSAGHRHF